MKRRKWGTLSSWQCCSKASKRGKAFTLVEVILVVCLLLVLIALTIPIIFAVRNDQRVAERTEQLKAAPPTYSLANGQTAIKLHCSEFEEWLFQNRETVEVVTITPTEVVMQKGGWSRPEAYLIIYREIRSSQIQ